MNKTEYVMREISCGKSNPWKIFRMIARILTVMVFVKGMSFSISFVKQGNYASSDKEVIVMLILMGIYLGGLLIGFVWNGLGGMLSMISLIFIFIYSIIFGDIREGIWLLSIALLFAAVPGISYLLAWYFLRREKQKGEKWCIR